MPFQYNIIGEGIPTKLLKEELDTNCFCIAPTIHVKTNFVSPKLLEI